jgi:hypothetical protein
VSGRRGALLAYATAGLTCLAVLLALVVLIRDAGEADRTAAAVARAESRIERQVRADCDFKRRVAELPRLSRHPTQAVIELAASARAAYVDKGCPAAGFGPPPPLFTPQPSPTPSR